MTQPSPLAQCAKAYAALLALGKVEQALEQHWAEDVVVYENRELALAGRAAGLVRERAQRATLLDGPHFQLRGWALNEETGVSYVELLVRFTGPDGRPQRLEQVLSQRWSAGKIHEERAYYEGLVDEGDPEHPKGPHEPHALVF